MTKVTPPIAQWEFDLESWAEQKYFGDHADIDFIYSELRKKLSPERTKHIINKIKRTHEELFDNLPELSARPSEW